MSEVQEFNQDRSQIARHVRAYQEKGQSEALNAALMLLSADTVHADDIFGKAMVRYLMHKKLWDYDRPLAGDVLVKFFATSPDRQPMTQREYITETDRAIKAWLDYDMPRPEVTGDDKRKKKGKKNTKEELKDHAD